MHDFCYLRLLHDNINSMLLSHFFLTVFLSDIGTEDLVTWLAASCRRQFEACLNNISYWELPRGDKIVGLYTIGLNVLDCEGILRGGCNEEQITS